MTHDRAAAEDIVQDVFVKIWNQRDTLEVRSTIAQYLFRATTNSSINYLRTQQRMVSDAEDIIEQIAAPVPEDDERSKNLKQAIEEAVAALPPRCRAIFVLHRYEGLRYQQIADHLGVSYHTVKNQMNIAMARLRTHLGQFVGYNP